MPGRREKTRCLTDVTVGQFADATKPHGRAAKPATDRRSFLCRLAAQGGAAAVQEEDYEEEEEEETFTEAATEVESDAETQAAAGTAAAEGDGRRRGQSRRKRRQPAAATAGGSVTYPALVWQLLGGYIHPESVGAFAALCRDSRRVTRSRAFWRCLYLHWAWGPLAAADDAAPHELRPGAILRCHQGVRPRVIRALHRWHFPDAAAAGTVRAAPPSTLPTGLRFLRFAVRGRRLLVLFRRGPAPPPSRPVPDCWETAVADDDGPDQRCPTEGQWLLTAELEGGVCPPACLEELLALDSRYVLAGFRCLTTVGGGKGGGRWCELAMRAPHGDSRAVGFACSGGGAAAPPRFLPWWRPGFLPALRDGAAD